MMHTCINAYRERICHILTESRGRRHGYIKGENERPMQTDKFHIGVSEEPKKKKNSHFQIPLLQLQIPKANVKYLQNSDNKGYGPRILSSIKLL